jgi:hypothetical protein
MSGPSLGTCVKSVPNEGSKMMYTVLLIKAATTDGDSKICYQER